MTGPGQQVLRTEQSWIQKTPGVCGGQACVRTTRLTVWGLVEWRQLGWTDDQILAEIPGLTAADLEAAWTYSEQHPAEIAQAIRANEEA